MTDLVLRPSADVSTVRHDPRDDWPEEARRLRAALVDMFGPDDPLPDTAGAWNARQKSRNTRRAYARGFLRWVEYARSAGVHPLHAKLPLADAYANRLENAPTWVRVKGGKPGEQTLTGPPLADSSRAQYIASCGSFYTYAARIRIVEADPFAGVLRPYVDPDYSPTAGMLPEETAALIETARGWAPRSYALVALLYLLGPRIDEVLSLNVGHLGYDSGHHTLPLRLKGGKRRPVPLPPLVYGALMTYLGDRVDGPIFITSTGRRWTETEAWKHLRVLARRAGIPQQTSIKPHMLRGAYVTDSLEAGAKLEDVQDSVGHSSSRTTQRYNKRRRRLDNHPGYVLAPMLAARLSPEETEGEG